jgi:cephalosporin hydroxylase
MTSIIPNYEENKPGADLIKCYLAAGYPSIKHSSYFQVYEEVLSKYRNTPFTFVEIGVLDGGSLFMWRKFFGEAARIIGIDMNPNASRWTADGFEIFIGSQEDPDFWKSFFESVGPVDVVLDDGGHSNSQQVFTAHAVLPHIRDGGTLIVEDVHASYMRDFGNPSKYSFMSYSKRAVDRINSRSSLLPWLRQHDESNVRDLVYSCAFYESIVCFNVDRRKCFISTPTINAKSEPKSRDFRHEKYRVRIDPHARLKSWSKSAFLLVMRLLSLLIFRKPKILLEKLSSWRVRKYF